MTADHRLFPSWMTWIQVDLSLLGCSGDMCRTILVLPWHLQPGKIQVTPGLQIPKPWGWTNLDQPHTCQLILKSNRDVKWGFPALSLYICNKVDVLNKGGEMPYCFLLTWLPLSLETAKFPLENKMCRWSDWTWMCVHVWELTFLDLGKFFFPQIFFSPQKNSRFPHLFAKKCFPSFFQQQFL